MAQTTAGVSGVTAYVAVSTNNSDWTDITGVANNIAFSGYDRQSGEAYTFTGDEAIVRFGKLSPTECTVTIVFSETITEGFGVLWGYHVAAGGTTLYVTYIPSGSATTGYQQFTSDAGKITNLLPPEAAAAPGDPLTTAFTFRTSGWAQTTSA